MARQGQGARGRGDGCQGSVAARCGDGLPARILPALRDPAGQLRCLPNPTRHELLVELVVLVDVEVAHFLVLGFAGGRGRSDVPRKKATLTYFVKQ